MSKLNVSVVAGPALQAEVYEPAVVDENLDRLSLTDPDYDLEFEQRQDIWKSLLQQEAEKPPIHFQSPQLEFRGTLVQQLRDVTKKLGLSLATLHTAVNQLDLFMDAHRLRADRLTHIALACLSIAAKSEEKFSRAPTLKTLSKISGVHLCGKTFRQLEWMVGQHVKWRLLAPTPVTFAALLAKFLVTDDDIFTLHPKMARRVKRDGAKLLDAYLDLTLSDVRLKVVESVNVGCACVSCARYDLGLPGWSPALAAVSGRQYTIIAPIARRLQRMMQIVKSRETNVALEVDQGYISARASPDHTPCASPRHQVSPATSTSSSSSSGYVSVENSYRHRPIDRSEYSVLDMSDSNVPPPPEKYPTAVDMTCHRADKPIDYRYRSRKLLDASLETVQPPTTNVAVKRRIDINENADFESKRYRLASHLSQVVL